MWAGALGREVQLIERDAKPGAQTADGRSPLDDGFGKKLTATHAAAILDSMTAQSPVVHASETRPRPRTAH
jgi:hypothetical protein